MDLHQVLCVCYGFHLGVFVGLLREHDYLSPFCLFFHSFPVIGFPFQTHYEDFCIYLFYLPLFCLAVFPQRPLVLLKRKQRSRYRGKGRWRELGGIEEGEIVVGMYCINEESIFNKKYFLLY